MMTLLGVSLSDVVPAGAARYSLWYVLAAFFACCVGAVALLRYAARPGGIDEAAIDPDDLITDAALDALTAADFGEHGQRYKCCPGCDRDVWRGELAAHARTCVPLRTLMVQPN